MLASYYGHEKAHAPRRMTSLHPFVKPRDESLEVTSRTLGTTGGNPFMAARARVRPGGGVQVMVVVDAILVVVGRGIHRRGGTRSYQDTTPLPFANACWALHAARLSARIRAFRFRSLAAWQTRQMRAPLCR